MVIGRHQVVAGWNLVHAVEQRPHLVPAEGDRLIDRFLVPARRDAGGEERLRFRGEVERATVPRVEERLDAEPIARREHRPPAGVPEHDSELAAQLVQALDAVVFEQVQRNFTVGPRAQAMAPRLELPLDRLVSVELTVDDDARLLVFAGDRLIAGREIDDAQARVTEPDASVF